MNQAVPQFDDLRHGRNPIGGRRVYPAQSVGSLSDDQEAEQDGLTLLLVIEEILVGDAGRGIGNVLGSILNIRQEPERLRLHRGVAVFHR